jgi:hypothetical protein
MIKLQPGNCTLTGSQRRQLLSWLKRTAHLGQRVGNFLLTITVRRVGRAYEMVASGHDAAGGFSCRTRGRTWRDVCREIVRSLSATMHGHRLLAMRA